MITLHTLGDSLIKVGDREVRPTSPVMYAALLYLSVERGQRVPRAALQELLFSEAKERSGAHSLRQLLYKLRQLGAPIRAEGDVLWIEPADVAEAAPPASNGKGASSAAYFSPGFAPRLSAAFDEWLERKRAQALAGQRRHLVSAMAARREAADWDELERLARQLLAADPFNEEATFALAEATALAGSKAEALRILERYEYETGRDDLKLSASVLRRRISEKLPDRRRLARDTPFLGRDAEMANMRTAIGHLRQGLPGCVVLVGEPGIGKTRLLDETGALALLEGVNVQTVRCQPHYVNRPMGIFIELVPQLLACPGALGVDPDMLEHLQLLVRHQDDRKHRPVDARDDATRSGILLAAVRDLVDAVSAEAPLLVAVEDAHWADVTSLQELTSLVRGVASRSLLVVYTTRMLEPLKHANILSDAVQVLRLKPLVDDAMLALARHLLPARGPAAGDPNLPAWCANTAGGNPLYLQTLCTHYEDTREAFTVPPSMRAATSRRIEQLPGDCRRILEFAALLGRHSSLEALRSLANLEPRVFLRALLRLEEEGLLRTRDGAARLSHDLLAECTVELVPPLSRQALHSCVATFLERHYERTQDASLLWECAEHRAESNERGLALSFLMRCARHLSDLGRATNALELLHHAHRFAETPKNAVELLRDTAVVAKAGGHWRVALDALQQLEQGHGLTDSSGSEWRFRLAEAAWTTKYDSTGAKEVLLRCVQSHTLPVDQRADAALLLVRICHELGSSDLADRAFESLKHQLESHSLHYSTRLLPIVYHLSFGDRTEASLLVDHALADLPRFAIADQLRAARNLSVALCYLGKPLAAADLSAKFYDQSVKLGLAAWECDFANNCCSAMIDAGDFASASRWYDACETKGVLTTLIEYTHALAGIEIALAARDSVTAAKRLPALLALDLGESIRAQSNVAAAKVRVAQLDPAYRCDATTLEQLRSLFTASQRLTGGDSLALALAEDARRGGADPAVFVSAYLNTQRRDLSPPLPALVAYAVSSSVGHAPPITEEPATTQTHRGATSGSRPP